MGASRKLQGEIDRVLKKVQEGVDVFDSIWNKVYDTENANQKEKFEADLKKEIKKLQRYRDQIKTWTQSSEIKDKKVSASYEQALMDARKLIEREMERFKVCEKETKTKAFSKEGLGQQPKTDPKEKAKSETRDWLNTIVGDLESQIDNFEAELEGLSVKKGKTRPPRLTHLEASITRHKAHILKLELILRLLDNDELSPDEVYYVKEFLEDYVERNQDNFEEFSDVDQLYSALPLDVEALEDLVTLGPSSAIKIALPSATQESTIQDQNEETVTLDNNSEVPPRTPPSKSGAMGSLVSVPPSNATFGTPTGSTSAATASIPVRPLIGGPTAAAILSVGGPTPAAILSTPLTARVVTENSSTGAAAAPSSSHLGSSVPVMDDDNLNFPGCRSSPAIPEVGLGRGVIKVMSNQPSTMAPTSLGSVGGISANGSLSSAPAVSDIAKRNLLSVDERFGSGLAQPMISPLSNRMLEQVSKSNDGNGSNDCNDSENAAVGGRMFSPSGVSGVQWRPQSAAIFSNQNEANQFRGRHEITPDQREKFLQKYEQVQQGQSTKLGVPHPPGTNIKQLSSQQQHSLFQQSQFNSQSSTLIPQMGLGHNVQAPSLTSVAAVQQQQPTVHQQSSPHPLISKDTDDGNSKIEQQQQQNFSDDLDCEPAMGTGNSMVTTDDDMKAPHSVTSATMTENNQLPRDADFSPGQPLPPSQPSSNLGVIGRRSVSDLGAIGDNVSGSAGNAGAVHDQIYNLQMLEAAFHRLPQPKDSERVKNYVPRHPAVTPTYYPQTQAPIVLNPSFWEQLGFGAAGADTLFYAFYYQQDTYLQYLAAKELKRQSWRYHKRYNTWFLRHEEPQITTDDFEKGTYVYFDFHMADDGSQHGWCQRIKNEFTFEYNFLEDDLVP